MLTKEIVAWALAQGLSPMEIATKSADLVAKYAVEVEGKKPRKRRADNKVKITLTDPKGKKHDLGVHGRVVGNIRTGAKAFLLSLGFPFDRETFAATKVEMSWVETKQVNLLRDDDGGE